MKKFLIAVLVLSIGNWLWCDLQDHYKKGEIVLKGVEDFGSAEHRVGAEGSDGGGAGGVHFVR